jgi:hypothetical protein
MGNSRGNAQRSILNVQRSSDEHAVNLSMEAAEPGNHMLAFGEFNVER